MRVGNSYLHLFSGYNKCADKTKVEICVARVRAAVAFFSKLQGLLWALLED